MSKHPQAQQAALDARDVADDPSRLLCDCSPESPFRLPVWRWLLAAEIAAGRKSPRRSWVDPWVRAAARVQAGSEARRPRRDARYRVVEKACAFKTEADSRAVIAVQARLLAGQSDDDVAAALAMEPGTIAAYRHVFFDVLDQGRVKPGMAMLSIGESIHAGLDQGDVAPIVKWVGYCMGEVALDPFLYWLGWPGGSAESEITPEMRRRLEWRFERLAAGFGPHREVEDAITVLRANSLLEQTLRSWNDQDQTATFNSLSIPALRAGEISSIKRGEPTFLPSNDCSDPKGVVPMDLVSVVTASMRRVG